METKIFSKENIDEAAEILRRGGLVAFPTETVYGLGGNGLDPEAARKIYAAKGRPSDNPLILHVAKIEEVLPLVDSIPEKARLLMESFWPGPLTLIMKKSPLVPLESTGGLQTVAIRCPDNALTLSLIEKAGIPVAGPSANLSGHPSPTEAAHVYHDLAGRIEGILDDGEVGIGVESTILDMSTDCPTLLRPGAITLKDLEEVLSEKPEVDPTLLGKKMKDGFVPKAPGMKYRHYAPRAEMILFRARKAENADRRIAEAILRFVREWKEQQEKQDRQEESQEEKRQEKQSQEEDRQQNQQGDRQQNKKEDRRKDSELPKIAILCAEETKKEYVSFCAERGILLKVLGKREEPLSMTHNLFRILRDCDEEGVELILSEAYSEEGVGFALMNRMKKAAGQKIMDID